jgi:proline iminopeptidase
MLPRPLDDDETHPWQVLHPPVQCHDSGWLEVGDGHEIYWESCGHPGAPVALFLHGGPGAGCTADDRRWFDAQRWRVVLFDQRGAGRSRVLGGADPLHANTTPHLLADIEALRQHLGVGRWLLFGGSWGATLALAYAEAHPQRVSGLVLRGVFLATQAERCWLYGRQGAARAHPAAWQRLWEGAGAPDGPRLRDAMHERLQDPAHAGTAAAAWWRWEQDLMAIETSDPTPHRVPDDAARLLSAARIGVHYARHGWFLREGQLLDGAGRLRGLPGIIVQGLRDLVTPAPFARALARAWPDARLCEVAAAGHASSHPAIARKLIAATAEMAAPEETPDDRPHPRRSAHA